MKRRQFITNLSLYPFALINTRSQASSFDDFVTSQQVEINQIKNDYEAYDKRYFKAVAQYQANISQHWSKTEITNQELWVNYNDSFKRRTVIDYAFNEIRISYKVSALIESSDNFKQEFLIRDLLKLLRLSERQAIDADPVNLKLMAGPNNAHSQQTELLSELIQFYDDAQYASEKLTSSALIINETEIINNESSFIAIAKIPLPDDAINLRKQKYIETITKTAKKWQLEPALILAIIHTQSHFNPLARSNYNTNNSTQTFPTFGLMQISPGNIGKDASKLMYGKSRLLTSNELYSPAFNINAGCAYLSMLDTRYLKSISNDQSRFYCMIAAYTASTGTVAEAFIGQRSMLRAFSMINQLTPKQVFKSLKDDLPDGASRDFFIQVTDHLSNYRKLISKKELN